MIGLFWDIFAPFFTILFVGLIAWAVVGYIQKDLYPLIVGGGTELLICYMLGWSIGKLLIIIPIIQFGVAGFIIYMKVKDWKNDTEKNHPLLQRFIHGLIKLKDRLHDWIIEIKKQSQS